MSDERIVDWNDRTYRISPDGSVAVWREAASGAGAVEYDGYWHTLRHDGLIAKKVRAEGLTEDEQRARSQR